MDSRRETRKKVTLVPGSKLGPYEILVRIGAGGMGEARLGKPYGVSVP